MALHTDLPIYRKGCELLALACDAGFHGLAGYFMREAGYAPPIPTQPQTEAELLTRRMESMVGEFARLTERLERVRGVPTSAPRFQS